jgi:NifU-like protein involved in Fe-S cluster formation
MSAPGSRVYEYVQDRRHVGELADASVGRSSVAGQPPHSTIYLRIVDGTVREGRFQTSGCGFQVACCGALIELCNDRPIAYCLSIGAAEIVAHLGGLPPTRLYCAELAIEALRDCLATAEELPAATLVEAAR